jgi:hypothetical protein
MTFTVTLSLADSDSDTWMKYFFACQTVAKNINEGTHNLVTVIEIMGRRNWLEVILKINLSVYAPC